ncbi:hypothetical protein FH972_024326 [Carpinus fangiana]|uniref:Protein kinase domain-containing protein n=1 Tax=Carpinus fangiana TaxID=176857 RepID=A0A5N6KYM0_9ROSI|nr:hypothetical protein FH972_024326 [Carpinus fangiana]
MMIGRANPLLRQNTRLSALSHRSPACSPCLRLHPSCLDCLHGRDPWAASRSVETSGPPPFSLPPPFAVAEGPWYVFITCRVPAHHLSQPQPVLLTITPHEADSHRSRPRSPLPHRSPPRLPSRRPTPSPTPERDDFYRPSRPRRRSPSRGSHRVPALHRGDSRSPERHRSARSHRKRRSLSSPRTTSRRRETDRAFALRKPSVDRYRGTGASSRQSPDLIDSYVPASRRSKLSPEISSHRSSKKRHRSPSLTDSRKHRSHRSRRSASPRLYRRSPSQQRPLDTNDLFFRKARKSRSPRGADGMRPSYSNSSRGGPSRSTRGGYDSHHSSSPYPPYPPPPASSHAPSPYWNYPPNSQAGSPPPPFPPSSNSPYPPTSSPGYPPAPPAPHPPFPHGAPPPPYPPAHNSSAYPPRESYRGGYDRHYERGNQYPQSDRRASGGSSGSYRGTDRPPPRTRGTFSNLSWTPATGSRGGKIEFKGRDGAKTDDDPTDAPSPTSSNKDGAPAAKDSTAPAASADNKLRFEFKSKAPPPPQREFPPPARNLGPRPLPPARYDSRDEYPPAPPRNYRDDYRDDYRDSRDFRGDYREDYRDDYRDDFRDRDDRRYYDRRFNDRYDERYDERPSRYYDRPPRDFRPPPREDRSREPRPERKLVKRVKARPVLSKEFMESDSVYFRKPGNESVVGSGTYGKVFKAIHVYTGNKVALKKIRMEGERDGFPITAIREVKLLQSLNHTNIVSLQEVMVERNDCYMVFEYLSHDLTGLLNHPSFKLEQHHKKDLAKQLFTGLDYLHRRGVLHRDIKAANILVSNTGQLKLADFGLARFFAKRRQLDYTNRVITIWYRSPELLLGETQYGPAVDIWSAACVLCEIFTKHAIFPGDGGEINQLDRIYAILGTPTRSEWPAIVETPWFELLRPAERKVSTFHQKYASLISEAAFDILQQMFAFDPTKRPDAWSVLQHRYFTDEEPPPRQATELEELDGDWHEFESKALRKERERSDREARRAQREGEAQAPAERKRSMQDVTTAGAPGGQGDGVERKIKRLKRAGGGDDMDDGVGAVDAEQPPPPPPAVGDEQSFEEEQRQREGSAKMDTDGS